MNYIASFFSSTTVPTPYFEKDTQQEKWFCFVVVLISLPSGPAQDQLDTVLHSSTTSSPAGLIVPADPYLMADVCPRWWLKWLLRLAAIAVGVSLGGAKQGLVTTTTSRDFQDVPSVVD